MWETLGVAEQTGYSQTEESEVSQDHSNTANSIGAAPVAEIPDSVIIKSTSVQKIYDTGKITVHALKGLDLSIDRGEMVAVMGPSGCGKTTLLNVLSGLDDVTEGEVVVEGRPIHTMPDRDRTRYRAQTMGFVFQAFNLLPVLSSVENVELPLLVAGVSPRHTRSRAEEALAMVGLAEQFHQRPAELSGGQQQRVAIARALVNDPAIVWADEPTGNLDSETSADVMDLLCKLNKEKSQTFVLVTHDLAVGRRADRILRMADGAIVEEQRPS
jgi:putative ABC transport system ATP-binding protein